MNYNLILKGFKVLFFTTYMMLIVFFLFPFYY